MIEPTRDFLASVKLNSTHVRHEIMPVRDDLINRFALCPFGSFELLRCCSSNFVKKASFLSPPSSSLSSSLQLFHQKPATKDLIGLLRRNPKDEQGRHFWRRLEETSFSLQQPSPPPWRGSIEPYKKCNRHRGLNNPARKRTSRANTFGEESTM